MGLHICKWFGKIRANLKGEGLSMRFRQTILLPPLGILWPSPLLSGGGYMAGMGRTRHRQGMARLGVFYCQINRARCGIGWAMAWHGPARQGLEFLQLPNQLGPARRRCGLAAVWQGAARLGVFFCRKSTRLGVVWRVWRGMVRHGLEFSITESTRLGSAGLVSAAVWQGSARQGIGMARSFYFFH